MKKHFAPQFDLPGTGGAFNLACETQSAGICDGCGKAANQLKPVNCAPVAGAMLCSECRPQPQDQGQVLFPASKPINEEKTV